jgi:cellulose synthase/poly-beta-1,6-N-acetylglucosamine synthase-like glycosyltransferase
MNTVLLLGAGLCILLVATVVLVLLAESVAGFRPCAPAADGASGPAPSFVVLMPAHDEEGTVGATVTRVLRQLPAHGRLLVVADNCSDGTAAEARLAGAEVIERTDAARRGKGHALAHGVAHLRSRPPAVVIVLDADCTPAPGALERLALRSARCGRPAQALYRMECPPHSPLRLRMAAFAWAMHNEVRPRGLHRLGLPCQLMGSGMALPWSCVERVDLASGHLVEDMQLGLKLAAAGTAPLFCPDLQVESCFPADRGGQESQRRRWEHGHLSMIAGAVPAVLWQALRQGNAKAIALAVDLCIPPLALLALLVGAACTLAPFVAGAGAAGLVTAAAGAASAFTFAVAVLLAWWSAGRRWIAWTELVSAPVYVLRKLPLYAGFLLRRQQEWVRTNRR